MSVPQQIGRYQIRDRIGSGGFATVWKAFDADLDADVAVKILAENWVERLDIRARFVEEARMLRRADSDRVVRVHDIGTLDDDRPYFVMSYANGGTLADLLAAGLLPVDRALWLAVEAARGIAVLHDLGVLHRDIKPSNILFRSAGSGERVVIADLGLAKAVAHASGFTVAAGTPGYMAPEQSRPGGGLDKRVDVYALGALTYQMLTGRRAGSPMTGEPTPPAGRLRPGLPPDTDAVVMRALEPNREARWADAGAFASAVGGLLQQFQQASRTRPAQPQQRAPVPAQPPPQGPVPTGRQRPAPQDTVPPANQQGPANQQAAPPAEHPSFPGRRVGPPAGEERTSYPGGPAEGRTPEQRKRRTRRLVTAISGLCVVALLAGLTIYYAVNRPVTVRTIHDQIVVEVPKDMTGTGTPSEQTVALSRFGGSGRGLELSTQPSPENLDGGSGITVIAGRSLPQSDSASVFSNATPTGQWLGPDCEAAGVSSRANNSSFQDGTLRTWTSGDCASKNSYGQAVLVGSGYAVHVYMVADKGQDVFDDIVRSIRVDKSSLPN